MYLTLSSAAEPHSSVQEPDHAARTASEARSYLKIAAGRHLYLEGDEATHVYEVKRGMLRLARVMENGRRQIVAFALAGDVIGFPEEGRHHTDCDAISNAVVAPYRATALENCRTDPRLHEFLTRAALHEICSMQDHFMMLASKSAAEKLAAFLLTLAERTGIPHGKGVLVHLPMLRVDIADFLGMTTETVCRTVTQFRKDALIALQTAQQVVLLDLEELRSRAEPE